MGVTVEKILALARHYVGYREKNHSWTDMESFLEDAGDGNYQRFELLATGGNGSQWCQYFIDALFIEASGSREAAKRLLCQDGYSVMTGYTPDGSRAFKDAGRWTLDPEPGDIVYFWSNSKGRIGHTGIVEYVEGHFIHTIEGNSNTVVREDGDVETNGGEVARHTYDISNVGESGAAVQGFGRPRYEESVSGATLRIGGNMATYKLETVKRGSKGTSVLLVQEILKARRLYTGGLDREFGPQTEQAVRDYQTARIKAGAKIGGSDGKADGEVGPATWEDLLGLAKV